MTTIWPGKPYPLGATWDGQGVNFALFSEHATSVELCLFQSPDDPHESERISMPEQTGRIWHVYLPGIKPGQHYGYRVHGAYDPMAGQRFNPHKLLVDPYAKAINGPLQWNDALFGYQIGDEYLDLTIDERDSAPFAPRSVVIDPAFDWDGDRPPAIPFHQSVLYELHVKGFTKQHPEVPEELRGTYAALAHPAVIEYLKDLGITAIELLPIHQHFPERHLYENGLSNYWGYNTLGFFAPDLRYSSSQGLGEQVREFKAMVKTLHAAGIEVILDVVYNHTAEADHRGPTLSLRGIDNMAYYRLVRDQPRYYMDYTGTGNTLNMIHPRTLQLVMDSLRYWITEMHVDGFRFDLASALARGLHDSDRLSAFFDIIQQDPIISQVKLIAEPWDIGPGGYQVGNFPVLWAEWNGRYRDAMRRYWKGDTINVAEIAYRLTGSGDLYQTNGRRPHASINFITAHDGFTLRDLVSYNHKHNEANGEQNRDGENHNNSWNCGIEGPSRNQRVNQLRLRQQRNFLATLAFSQGVPMLVAGDEFSRTQHGNNNAYCQDNEISWVNWDLSEESRSLLNFTRRLLALRREHPALTRRQFFQHRPIHGTFAGDIDWYRPDGVELTDQEWHEGSATCIGMLLDGEKMKEWDEQGRYVKDDVLLLLLNAHHNDVTFRLPDLGAWELVIDTALIRGLVNLDKVPHYRLKSRSLALLRLLPHAEQ